MMLRRLIAFFSIFLFFVVLWFLQSSKFMSISSLQSLIFMNNSAFGYNSFKAYALFYTIPFIFLFNNFFLFEKYYTVIRLPREKLYVTFIIKIFIISVVFSVTQMLVNDFLSILFLDWKLLKETNYFFISLNQMIALIFYFLWIGILYRIIYDISSSSSIALFTTYFIVGSIYFCGLIIIPTNIWDPFKDLNIFQSLLENKREMMDVLFAYLRQFSIGIVLYLVGSSVFLKKDII